MGSSKSIGIVTIADDLHGQFIAAKLSERFDRRAFVFETNKMLSAAPNFQLKDGAAALGVNDHFNEFNEIQSIDVIWWRRFAGEQIGSENLISDHRLLSDVSFGSLCRGIFSSLSDVAFVSNPQNTVIASNKIFQLSNASRYFENIPDTAATSSFAAVKEVFDKDDEIIIKPIENALNKIVFTVDGSITELDQERFSNCPAIIQQKIRAKYHLRVNFFGSRSSWFSIKATELDWRSDLDKCDIVEVEPDIVIEKQCERFLEALGLCMGIFDFIVDESDMIFFIEVNPQGQFLFLQPFAKHDMAEAFCDFLISQ